MNETLWPHFKRLNVELQLHLDQVATQVIEHALDDKTSEAEERDEPQRALPAETEVK